MAKEEKPAEGAAPPKKSKKLLIIILAAVLLIVVAGGGAAFFLLKKGDEAADDEEVATEKEKPKKKKGEKAAPPVYIAMDAFTVNLVPETGDQYLQVTINVEAEDAAVGETMKVHMPKLRNRIMLILSSKKASELASREGKEALAEEIRESINGVIGEPPAKGKKEPSGPVKEVLFTAFIIQ